MPTQTDDKAGRQMLLKILVVGAVLIGAMGAIRDGRILRDAGLLSSCSAVAVSRNSEPT
jgi:hypothetical protein